MEYDDAKRYLIRILSKKGYFSVELLKKLKQKGVEEGVAAQLVEEFTEKGYVDDEALKESFVQSRINKHESASRIKQKLRSRGVVAKQIDYEEENAEESIAYLLKTRYRSRDLTDFHERQKVIASLMRKGFPFDLIKSQLDK